ncbi:tyrosine-type recombinase/integrase [Sporosarcina sp. JAI121]|uniref:tyrosine-type recombinase/integrase n=1 Tax=Sporosarcina sp. JAI121 TaxID=2723064 RepID=UPI0015C8FB91|nr:tyrosine-type recombinase/integrase [Sporosarcina sp. JAI121]NYF23562.1 site-specific recombinase XerD [Sporosarcina sp. JAI121]
MNHLETFGQWLIEDGKSPKTIESYCNDVKQFQLYLAEKAADEQQPISRFSFVRYKQHLLDEAFKVSTINKKVNSLKVFNDFLRVKGIVTENYIQLKKDCVPIATGSEQVVNALTDKEVEKVLFYVQDTAKVSRRNRLIIHLLLYTAVRVSELVNIKLTDINGLTFTLMVRGKGGKVREIGIRNDVMELIKEYQVGERKESRFHESDYLLVSQRSGKMHRDAVRDWLAKISDDVGIKLHPHLFRRTCATLLLRRGVPIVTVSKILGHHSVDMTSSMYIQTSRKDKQDALDLL